MSIKKDYLVSVRRQFAYYRSLAEKSLAQVPRDRWFHQLSEESNSMAIIMQHLAGNMLSRWTDLFSSDGEKPWRNRDAEFAASFTDVGELMEYWNKGWNLLEEVLNGLQESDLERIIFIRNEGHTVAEAINRQLAHYPYHVGQMVFLAKILCEGEWHSLSIPRNRSAEYNQVKSSTEQRRKHFLDEDDKS